MYSPPLRLAAIWRGCADGKAKNVANPPLGPALVVVVVVVVVK
jgi:hypothetical protein